MTLQRVLCLTSATWHGKHYMTDRRWRITTPDNTETVLCSAACALSWLVSGLPADFEAAGANTGENTELPLSGRLQEAVSEPLQHRPVQSSEYDEDAACHLEAHTSKHHPDHHPSHHRNHRGVREDREPVQKLDESLKILFGIQSELVPGFVVDDAHRDCVPCQEIDVCVLPAVELCHSALLADATEEAHRWGDPHIREATNRSWDELLIAAQRRYDSVMRPYDSRRRM